ncbi:cobyrinate a,c-diamide synthase [Thermodesulfobacterium hydrogeniphilum]|uniref:cobyrinate a,c-diamide synthase n=1 Tax=Thermodesulfobacterium hydrogeniphilum TaxID=161156 RepID=UPI00056E6D26|nr:cobyrinate a,c-diamide synthase [Thermodesulfobacterium hydrogeniphilum]
MSIVYKIPRILISSHKGGAGKTLFTIGLISVLRDQGLKVSAFKKGPDYIDAGWLSKVSQVPCRNLDLFLFNEADNLYSFYLGSKDSEIAIIEGNRGLFDGMDIYGSCSTAKLAQVLKVPIIIVLDCTKVTRSLAALVKGFLSFEEGIDIKGVILNKIARSRHENIIRESIEYYTNIKVLGSIPKLKNLPPERHLGLITSYEYEERPFLEELKEAIRENVDLNKILEISKKVEDLKIEELPDIQTQKYKDLKIGVFRDEAFQFYYPENLESLCRLGAEIRYINAFKDRNLPSDISALYLGGGFPEVQAEALSENKGLLKDIKEAVLEGMPVYAECGGFMYLGKKIIWKNKEYPVCGVLPIVFKVEKRPQGHGYVIAKVIKKNPYFKLGYFIKGHEFHYSKPIEVDENKEMRYIFELKKGFGIDGKKDGILFKNLLASYTHIHIFSVKYWAEKFLEKAQEFKQK